MYREKIQEIVGSAMSQCRRDLLWQRMLLPGNVTEEEGRRKRRSEHDEGKEPVSLVSIECSLWNIVWHTERLYLFVPFSKTTMIMVGNTDLFQKC